MIRVAAGQDFLFALHLWTTISPYRDFPSRSIHYRLTPAFLNKRLLILSHDGKPVGFCTWGWMTDQEYETRRYYGPTVFSRETSDRLVVPDIIATRNVIPLCRELGRMFRAEHGVERVYSYRERGRRLATYCI